MSKSFAKKIIHQKEAKEFEEEVIQIDRVTRVVKGGRRLRFRATVAIGDKKGRVGIGIGKSNEVSGAIQKAVSKAKKSMIKIPIVQGTIPHELKIKFKSAKIILFPAAPGTGIIAGGATRKILDLAGVQNVLSKSFGSSNKLSCSKATISALKKLKTNPFLKYKIKEGMEIKEQKVEVTPQEKRPFPKKNLAKKPILKMEKKEQKPQTDKKETPKKETEGAK